MGVETLVKQDGHPFFFFSCQSLTRFNYEIRLSFHFCSLDDVFPFLFDGLALGTVPALPSSLWLDDNPSEIKSWPIRLGLKFSIRCNT